MRERQVKSKFADKCKFVTLVLVRVKLAAVHRRRKSERIGKKVKEKTPRDLGPADTTIHTREKWPTVILRASGSMSNSLWGRSTEGELAKNKSPHTHGCETRLPGTQRGSRSVSQCRRRRAKKSSMLIALSRTMKNTVTSAAKTGARHDRKMRSKIVQENRKRKLGLPHGRKLPNTNGRPCRRDFQAVQLVRSSLKLQVFFASPRNSHPGTSSWCLATKASAQDSCGEEHLRSATGTIQPVGPSCGTRDKFQQSKRCRRQLKAPSTTAPITVRRDPTHRHVTRPRLLW